MNDLFQTRDFRAVNGYYSYRDFVDSAKRLLSQSSTVASVLSRGIKQIQKPKDLLEFCCYDDKIVPEFAMAITQTIPFFMSQERYVPCFILDSMLFQALTETDLPQSACISKAFAKHGIILFPKQNKAEIKYLAFFETSRSIICFYFNEDGVLWGALIQNLNSYVVSEVGEIPANVPCSISVKDLIIKQIFLYKSAYPSAELTYEQQARHGLIVPDKKRGVMGYNPKKLSPIIIGENYRIKRERVEATGTHASPQTHWRSGHWRQQPIGKRDNPEYKTIWIEPVLVNG